MTFGAVIGVALLIMLLLVVVIIVIVGVFVQWKRKTLSVSLNNRVCQFILNNTFHVTKHILCYISWPYGQYHGIYCAIPNICKNNITFIIYILINI